jgi:hypothetical protein
MIGPDVNVCLMGVRELRRPLGSRGVAHLLNDARHAP